VRGFSLVLVSISFGVRFATLWGSKPKKASLVPSHLASTTRQLMPDWNTAFDITSR